MAGIEPLDKNAVIGNPHDSLLYYHLYLQILE